jgi:hypothetical protein
MLRAGAAHFSDAKRSWKPSCFHIAGIDFARVADVAYTHQTPAREFGDMTRIA